MLSTSVMEAKSAHSSESSNISIGEDESLLSVSTTTPEKATTSSADPTVATKSPVACQVCGESSPSMRPGSTACEACKKFFMRNFDSSKKFSCENGGKCMESGSTVNRRSCQACRMTRCLKLGLSDKVRPPKPAIDLRFVPCAVCGASSTGYHFGILSCEGCKGFFRRSVKYDLAKNFTCDTGGKCVIDPLRQKCKRCRFDRCISSGMSPTGSHIGRHTNAQRAETKREIERLQNEQKLLKQPIMVRQMKRGAAAASLNAGNDISPASISVKLESVTSPMESSLVEGPSSPVAKRRPPSRSDAKDIGSVSASEIPMAPPQSNMSPAASSTTDAEKSDAPARQQMAPEFDSIPDIFGNPGEASPRFTVDHATLIAAQSLMSIIGHSHQSPLATSTMSDSTSHPSPFSPDTDVSSTSVFSPGRMSDSWQNLSGITNFLQRLNTAIGSPPSAPSSSFEQPTHSQYGESSTSRQTVLAPFFDIKGSSFEDNSRQAILRRIRVPVAPSNFIWLYNSGSDWTTLANIFANSQSALQPRGDPFSLQNFVRLLDSGNLLTEPTMSVYPRTEWLLAQVTNAVRNLSHIKNLRIYFDPGWTADEVWRQGMVCFEHHTRYTLAFVRSLPGYASLSPQDRTSLFTSSLFPLVVAQLSLDYDMQEREENFLSMDHVGRELMTLNFPPLRQLRRHIVDAGVGIKTSQLNIVEFGLIAALVFFNSDVPNLGDVEKVKQIAEEFRMAASIFISRTCTASVPNSIRLPGQPAPRPPAEERLQLISQHVHYLSSLHQTHQSVMMDFARLFPHLVDTNPLHLEMYTSNSIQPPPPEQQPPPPQA